MDFRRHLSSKNIVILVTLLALALVTFGYLLSRKPARVPMSRSVPANALAYVEVNSLPDLIDGLTDTKAWNELAPALGLSSQLKQLGSGIGWMSSTGLGPDEVVIAGRAQYAVAVTGIDAGTGSNDEGVYLNVKPRFALIVETHADADKAAKLVSERASIIAGRIFGEGTKEESSNYQGTRLMIFRGAQPERQLVAASSGSVALIANHESAIKACLDALTGRVPSLADDEALKQRRGEVDHDGAIFAYVTETGVENLAQFGPAIFAARFTNNPDALSAVASLFGHISKQTASGLFYSLKFADGQVVETSLTALRSPVAAGLREATKAATGANFGALNLVPKGAEECTVLTIEAVGAWPENLLKHLSPGLDVVAGLALREFVINFRKSLGLEASDSLGDAIGNEIALVKLTQGEPVVMVIQVRDRARLQSALSLYLAKGNTKTSTEIHHGIKTSIEAYHGIEISASSDEEGRAAAFVDNFLVLGSAGQIKRMIDAKEGNATAAAEAKVRQAIAGRPQDASILSYEADEKKTGRMMLAISRLTRVTDGSAELLENEPMRKALSRLPLSASYTSFRDSGVYTESHSAVGVFRRIGEWLE